MQAFGNELRTLREAAGRPKYAVLAQRTGRSQTTLSEAAGGQRFPTWETVEAFVRACNGDVVQWRQRWLDTAAAVRGASTDPEPSATPTAAPAAAPQRAGRVRAAVAAAVVVTVLAVVAVLVWRSSSSGDRTTALEEQASPRPTSSLRSAPDGADPKDSRCAYDPNVTTLDSVELDQNGQPRGLVELRYAPECGMAWPRFSPFPQAGIRPGTAIHVAVQRPADDKQAAYQAPSVGALVFGGMLRSTSHCVIAVIALAWLGSDVPTRTKCFRGNVLVQPPD